MNPYKLEALIDADRCHSGDILTSDGSGFISEQIALATLQDRSHAMQIFKLTPRVRSQLADFNLTFANDVTWILAESTFIIDGWQIKANGPRILHPSITSASLPI